MKKRILISLFVLVVVLSMAATALAEEGPPWSAVIQRSPGDYNCYTSWAKSDFSGTVRIYGDGVRVIQYDNGIRNSHCHGFIDFSDPALATLEQVCAAVPQYCNGDGAMIRPVSCYMWDGVYSTDADVTVTPSGEFTLRCHYNPFAP